MKSALRASFALACCTALAAAPASAKPATKAAAAKAAETKQLAAAKKHYSEGAEKYKAGDYAGALAEFQAADDIKPTPQAARYIGLCLDGLGRYQAAIAAFERFLSNAPVKMAAQADEVRARVAAIRQLPGKIHFETDPKGASVEVDGTQMAASTPADVEVAPGHHKVHFAIAGHDPVDREIDVTFASRHEVTVTLAAPVAPAPPPPPPPAPVSDLDAPLVLPPPPTFAPEPPPPPPPPRDLTPALVLGGAAVAAVGVGAVFGGLAVSDQSSYKSHPTEAKADQGQQHAQDADICFAIGGAFAVAGALYAVLRNMPTPERAHRPIVADHVELAPLVTAHGGGAGAIVRF
jgi:hypothetical protein